MAPLYVAIVWHMHQPYYREPGSDVAVLPWVRLHAVKDYLHMAQVVEAYPDVHVTFTLVPSLAEQIEDYVAGRLQDRLMLLARQNYFSPDDKRYLLNICFSIQWRLIRQYPPYAALLARRPLALLNPDYFSEQSYRDLIVWFNLVWTDPNLLETDPVLQRLIAKGSDFRQADVEALLERHLAIMAAVIPTYRRLQERGQIEVITVPYFHPILPLLIDSHSARCANPGLAVPEPAFRHPEDAEAQVTAALRFHERLLGRPARGLWPSEGAVSPEVAALAARHGLHWLATDEAILGRSLGFSFVRDGSGFVQDPARLYRPYRLLTPAGGINLVFRDHDLSDRIGFTYQHLGGMQAAEDLIVRLKHIHHRLARQERPGLVAIILDGENAWEHYEHNGDVFLHELYRRLQADPDLRAVTVSEYLEAYPTTDTLSELATGSWIGGDLTTWMGDPEHLEAWSRLRDLRQAVATWLATNPPSELQEQVQRLYHIAEGSDWFWWYSVRNSSEQDALFDHTFLAYLAAAYEAIGQAPPPRALLPIQGLNQQPVLRRGFLRPPLTADPDPQASWATAAVLRVPTSTGTMQRATSGLRALRYGNDEAYLYLRVELGVLLSDHALEIHLRTESDRYLLSLGRGQRTVFLYRLVNGMPVGLGLVHCAQAEQVLELAVPLARLDLSPLRPGLAIGLTVVLDPGEAGSERLPATGEHVDVLATA